MFIRLYTIQRFFEYIFGSLLTLVYIYTFETDLMVDVEGASYLETAFFNAFWGWALIFTVGRYLIFMFLSLIPYIVFKTDLFAYSLSSMFLSMSWACAWIIILGLDLNFIPVFLFIIISMAFLFVTLAVKASIN